MVRFALLGAGRIGLIHAGNIVSNPRARLECVFDADAGVAERAASKRGVRVARSAQSAIEADEVDAVLIASSTNTHVDLIVAAVQAGKPVLCEKPIDLDIDRIEGCKAAVAGSGIAVQIGFNRRYDRSHRAVRNAVSHGEIGPLELLVISSRDPGLPPMSYLRTSGGIFCDMTIHDFDLARFILGNDPIQQLCATGSVMVDSALNELCDVDTAMVVMKAASGALVHINNSRRAVYGYDQRVEAFGAKGMVQSDNLRPDGVTRHGATAVDMKSPLISFFLERYKQAYIDELDDFIDVVTERRKPAVDFEDGRIAQILANAARESLRTGKTVNVKYG